MGKPLLTQRRGKGSPSFTAPSHRFKADVHYRGLDDFEKNKKWLVQRVLEYGLLKDWLIIYKYYGISKIAQIAMQLKELDDKSLSFISLLSDIPKEKFLCYTTKQLIPKHWNF